MEKNYKKIEYNQDLTFYLNKDLDLKIREIEDKLSDYFNLSTREDYISLRRNRKVVKDKLGYKSVYLKSYSPLHADSKMDKLKNIRLFKSNALKEFEALLALERLNLAVVKPLLVIERNLNAILEESILITLSFAGVEAREIMKSDKYSYQLKKSIMEAAAKNLLLLHQGDIIHRDYRFRNVLIRLKDKKQFDLVLLDLERAKIDYKLKYKKIKDWAKLIANWIDILSQLAINKSKKKVLIKNERKKYQSKIIKEYKLNKLELKLFNKWIKNSRGIT